jgi:hypothetical protein
MAIFLSKGDKGQLHAQPELSGSSYLFSHKIEKVCRNKTDSVFENPAISDLV